ncbi:MAG: hypothetical protein U9O98_02705, partial [Asgard group archaeon]|nr:hypothetical protein [Asgard group archaeon]
NNIPNYAAIVLIEFDSTCGPLIRKICSKNDNFNLNKLPLEFLLWTIQAKEFSVRKINSATAFARQISLIDPNFKRKKRQFGFALITKETIALDLAEKLLQILIFKIKQKGNYQPYFRMLKNISRILEEEYNKIITELKNKGIKDIEESSNVKMSITETLSKFTDSNRTIKKFQRKQLPSSRLLVFQKVAIYNKTLNKKIIIGSKKSTKQWKNNSKQTFEMNKDEMIIRTQMWNGLPKLLSEGLEILGAILIHSPPKAFTPIRLLIAIEFLDKLLYEKIDIQYFLPFIQYLLVMEGYTITYFDMQAVNANLVALQKTHGSWVSCLIQQTFQDQPLTYFFEKTQLSREALELLIDLFFMKIIRIF